MEQHGRVIFVDDDRSVLRSLRRGLRLHYKSWDMRFEESPEAALQYLKEFDAWVIVSDKKMRELDGADFLSRVAELTPQTIRVLLSGDISEETAVASAEIAHLLLPKPFELDDLIDALERSVCLRSLPISSDLRQQLGQLKSLPVLPKVYQELSTYLNETELPDNADIAGIVAQDLGILSKLLQMANSPFFGFSSPVDNVEAAIVRLGHDLVRQIVLSIGLFSTPIMINDDLQESNEGLLQCSEEVAAVMRELAISAGLSKQEIDRVYILGLLHQVGLLVDIEEQRGHSDVVGAYILQLWGFDSEFVEAVLFQGSPEDQVTLTPLTCFIFLAKAVVEARNERDSPLIDMSDESVNKIIDKTNAGTYFREKV